MTAASITQHWSAPLTISGDGGSVGYAVCPSTVETDRFVIATAANLALVDGYIAGLLLDNVAAGASARVMIIGPLDRSTLGAGAADNLYVDTNGRLVRVGASLGVRVVGWVNSFGDGLFDGTRIVYTSAARGREFNPIDYGAAADFEVAATPTDIGAALQLAGAAALNEGGGRLIIDYDARYVAGAYGLSTAVAFDYSPNQLGADLQFIGVAGGAPIAIRSTFSSSGIPLTVNNADTNVTIERLSFFPETQTNPNCVCVIYISPREIAVIRECAFFGITCSDSIVRFNACQADMKNVAMRGCSGGASGSLVHVINARFGVNIERFRAADLGAIGTHWSGNHLIQGKYGILIESATAFSANSGPIRVVDTFIDEGYLISMRIAGDPSARLPWVRVDGLHSNLTTVVDQEVCGIDLQDIDYAEVANSNCGYTTWPMIAGVQLRNVRRAEVSYHRTSDFQIPIAGQGANRISADASCDDVRLIECRDCLWVDSLAKKTVVELSGLTTTVRQSPTTTAVEAIVEGTDSRIAAIAGGGGTGTVTVGIPNGSDTEVECLVTSSDTAGTAVYSQKVTATVRNPISQAVVVATTAATPIADAGYGATAAAITAGSGATRDKAVLTITNQHATAKDFRVEILIRKHWPDYHPSQFGVDGIWAQALLGLYLPSGIINSGGVVATWTDSSGRRNDLTAAGALRPTYTASAGPNSLPACTFTGTQRMSLTLGSAIRQCTAATVGTFTAIDQTHVALSSSSSSMSTNSVYLGCEGANLEIMRETSVAGGGNIAADYATYHTRIGTIHGAQADLWRELTNGSHYAFGLATDSLLYLTLGAKVGGATPLTGAIQAVAIFDQAMPASYTVDGGRMIKALSRFFRNLTGTV